MYNSTVLDLSTMQESSASRLSRFTPGKTTTDAHWIVGWFGTQSRSGRRVEEKNLTPTGNRTPAFQSIALRNELSDFLQEVEDFEEGVWTIN
jgi:hypothetical protein